MFHNRSGEDTLGPRWTSQQPYSNDSLFYPDICLSTNKRQDQDPHVSNTVKKSPLKRIESQGETPKKSAHDTSLIEERGSYYISKKYGIVLEREPLKERTRRNSLSFLVEKSDNTKRKEKKEKQSQSKDDYKLQVKIEGLKNLIKTEKEMMLGLKKKISSEKSELSVLQQKLTTVKSKSKKKSKQLGLNKSTLALVQEAKELDDSVISRRQPDISEKMLKKRSSAAFPEDRSLDKSLSILAKDSPYKYGRSSVGKLEKERKETFNSPYKHRRSSTGISRGNNEIYDEKMVVLEDSIRQLKLRYEKEIGGLRSRLGELRNENLRLKETTAYDKGCERIQVLQEKRLQDLVETLGKKERELVVQERYYKEQIDTMGMKVISLNDDMEKALKNQEKVKNMENQIQNKNTDIDIMKQYFIEKLKSNVEDHYNQKKEWSHVHNDLVKEINTLKVKENFERVAPFPSVSYVTEPKYKGKGSRI